MQRFRSMVITIVTALVLVLVVQVAGPQTPQLLREVGDQMERVVTRHLINVWVGRE